ncbi:4-oxalocrotonate tautomerase family protein [Nocardia sp. 2YAB30]|uniref:tautomerase family protein n=1 Tax=unclassified Nocardia TaxID=2637762 RepID=UPI003F982AF0
MPIIDISLSPGRTENQLRELVREVTLATNRAIGTPVERIRVLLREVPDTHWAAGGVTIAEEKADR